MTQPSLFALVRADPPARYPDVPGSKGADTSREAAASVAGRVNWLRELVLVALEVPRTADEVATLLDKSVLTIRPRVAELHKQGQVRDTGVRRKNASGRNAAVWQAV